MTASMAGTGTCLAAKGLDISLAALKRQDPYINNIVDVASQVALYTFSNRANEWEKTDVEGTLFVYTRLASPRHGFTIMNRLNMDNLTEPITKDLDFQLQDPFLLYRNARLSIYGIWFYDKADCLRIAELMKDLTRQEQLLAQRDEDVSPRAVRMEDSKGVDILQMLTKARDEYDKGKPCSEPKEIASSSVIYDNPHLIKPIPVKPLERPHGAQQSLQDSDVEPRHLSLAALFGAQSQPEHMSPQAGSGGGRPAGPRPAVARSLSYEEPARPGAGGPLSGSPPQHCPAIQKLMSAQRAPTELLQPVSESPENRLCENGVLQPPHHCQGRDPLHRLFQNPPAAAGPPCCAHPPPPLQQPPPLHGHPGMGGALPLPHPHHPAAKPLFFSPGKPQLPPQGTGVVSPEELLQRLQLVQQEQSLSAEPVRPALAPRFQDPALQPRPQPHPQALPTLQPHPQALPTLQPHPQALPTLQPHPQALPTLQPHPQSHPQALPALQPHPHPQSLPAMPLDGWTDKPSGPVVSEKPNPLFQGISPQRVPVTTSPTLLMSPMVFAQSKSAKAGIACSPTPVPAMPPQAPEDPRTLTKSQLQATLLHLIQTDAAFLDTIYKAYICSFSKDTVTKKL